MTSLNGASPAMGTDKNFINDLQAIIGRVRIEWSTAVATLSVVAIAASFLVREGWVEAPAKERDVHVIQMSVDAHTKALTALSENA
jgi:hypothetical protein